MTDLLSPAPSPSASYAYHIRWSDRDAYPHGTQVMMLRPPVETKWNFLIGQTITLTDDAAGLAVRCLLMALTEEQGARFQVREALL